MRIPNKLYSYQDSQFPLFPLVVDALEAGPKSPAVLFESLKDSCPAISDFTDVLDALYALGIVGIDAESGEVRLVN